MTSRIVDDAGVRSAIALLSAWIESQMAYAGLPGLSIGIVHDQEDGDAGRLREQRRAGRLRGRRVPPPGVVIREIAGKEDMMGPQAEALVRAVELLATGAWQQAHEIVQKEDSAQAAWLHGIVHILEGDLKNAQGWYTRAGRPFPGADNVQSEIAAARAEVVQPPS